MFPYIFFLFFKAHILKFLAKVITDFSHHFYSIKLLFSRFHIELPLAEF